MADIQNIYLQFLGHFPLSWQPIVSLVLAVLIIYSIFRIIQKDFIFIIALIVLVPGSVPIFESLWSGVVTFMNFLFSH